MGLTIIFFSHSNQFIIFNMHFVFIWKWRLYMEILLFIWTKNLSQASTVRFGIIHYFIYIIIHSGLKNFMDACEFTNEFICKFIQSNNQWIHQFIQTNNLSHSRTQNKLLLKNLQLCFSLFCAYYFFGHTAKTAIEQVRLWS